MSSKNLFDLQTTLAGLPVRSALLELRQFSPVDFRTGQRREPHWAGVLIGGNGEVHVRDLGVVAASAGPVGEPG